MEFEWDLFLKEGEEDADPHNAGKQTVTLLKGASILMELQVWDDYSQK